MLVSVITDPSLYNAKTLLALTQKMDAFELRLDYFREINLDKLRDFMAVLKAPVIFTLRKKEHGGHYKGCERERLQLIQKLIALNPDYFDIESDVPISEVREIKAQNPTSQLICSYHNFDHTPEDLDGLLDAMISPVFSIYKLATLSHTALDAIRMLLFVKKRNKDKLKVAGLCMGEFAGLTRILTPMVGGALNYTFWGEEKITAPGQIDVDQLINVYNYQHLNRKTKLFFLLGYPVDLSVGHVFHNHYFKRHGVDAVYIKVNVKPAELCEFIDLVKLLPFSGASVTMPLKLEVAQYLDGVDKASQQMGSMNTLCFRNNVLRGTSTDGQAVVDLMNQVSSIAHKNILILGAGGAARSVACLLARSGANIYIKNRTHDKAIVLARLCKGCVVASDEMAGFVANDGYDFLINTTSLGMTGMSGLPIAEDFIIPGTVVIDMVSNPEMTELLELAKTRHCAYITGKEIYIKQAELQLKYWLS